MSSDTAKEHASNVDSSVTERKNDVNNLDNLESPCHKGVEDADHSGAEEQGRSGNQVGISSAIRNGKLHKIRYFIIKSINHQNIQLSMERGIWATQVMNEPILEEAFRNSGKVILIFSVNMSGFFQGYAQMISSVGWRRDNVWSKGSGGNNPWGRSFKVKWLRLYDLPFQKTLHLKNPLNHFKPVKISRDCQELPQDIGEALCELLDGNIDVDDRTKRGDLSLKRPFMEPSCSLRGEEYNVPPLHMPLAGAPVLYPPLFYHHHQAEENAYHLAHQTPTSVHVDHYSSSQFDIQNSSMERSPVASDLTEDDILEMTYEEYLEVAHSRASRMLPYLGDGPSWGVQGPSVHQDQCDALYSRRHSSKRTRHKSLK